MHGAVPLSARQVTAPTRRLLILGRFLTEYKYYQATTEGLPCPAAREPAFRRKVYRVGQGPRADGLPRPPDLMVSRAWPVGAVLGGREDQVRSVTVVGAPCTAGMLPSRPAW
jgi:hypothetical protein